MVKEQGKQLAEQMEERPLAKEQEKLSIASGSVSGSRANSRDGGSRASTPVSGNGPALPDDAGMEVEDEEDEAEHEHEPALLRSACFSSFTERAFPGEERFELELAVRACDGARRDDRDEEHRLFDRAFNL